MINELGIGVGGSGFCISDKAGAAETSHQKQIRKSQLEKMRNIELSDVHVLNITISSFYGSHGSSATADAMTLELVNLASDLLDTRLSRE